MHTKQISPALCLTAYNTANHITSIPQSHSADDMHEKAQESPRQARNQLNQLLPAQQTSHPFRTTHPLPLNLNQQKEGNKKRIKMPTPESAAFLAKKPTVPPTYEGVDFEDNVALHNARDAIIREQWVRSMMSRLVGEELGKCYAREGVNHLEKCGKLRGEFSSGGSFVSERCVVVAWLMGDDCNLQRNISSC